MIAVMATGPTAWVMLLLGLVVLVWGALGLVRRSKARSFNIVLVVLVILTILRILGVPLEPVLAASGIGGVALAFGAQSLVKDYISGILMIFEDQFGVGDLIDTGEVVGTVQEVG